MLVIIKQKIWKEEEKTKIRNKIKNLYFCALKKKEEENIIFKCFSRTKLKNFIRFLNEGHNLIN